MSKEYKPTTTSKEVEEMKEFIDRSIRNNEDYVSLDLVIEYFTPIKQALQPQVSDSEVEELLEYFVKENDTYKFYRNNGDLITYRNRNFEMYIDYINQLIISPKTVKDILIDLGVIK